MVSKNEFQRTIRTGELNLSTWELVRNWCSHARLDKFGGIGLIEAQTGLPIGHHSIKCDHAGAAGMSTWDLRDAALDFHDRNCVDCKLRKPQGFPNLSTLVKERDDKRAAQIKMQALEQAKQADALKLRKAQRSKLRDSLGPVAGAILDHIEEFDEHRTREHSERIRESARLAPEHFEPQLTEYVLELAEREDWFADTALSVLKNTLADRKRVARLALVSIANSAAIQSASQVLLENLVDIEASGIVRALPPIIELARPHEDILPFSARAAEEPALLQALWQHYRRQVEEGLHDLLTSRNIHHVDTAARGVLAISEKHGNVFTPFVRTMVAKFSRARFLLDDFDDDDLYGSRNLHNLLKACSAAFNASPRDIDTVLQDMIQGSDRQSRERCYEIYRLALNGPDRERETVRAESESHRLAFQRILWAATSEDGDGVLNTAHDILRGRPRELEAIARVEFDGLLGALLVWDDRLRKQDEAEQPSDMLQVMERQNKRSSILALMQSAVEWASIVAKGEPRLIQKIVDLLDKVPEGRDNLRGVLLGSVEHLGETVDGLKLLLPHLYHGLVGSSVLVRSYAASAVGELSSRNVPPLVYEAFAVLLWDQYVAVHKSAVHALRFFHLPEAFRGRAAQALLNLIRYYSERAGDDRFVVECVSLLASELHRLGRAKSEVAKYLVQVLLKADPLYVRSELRWLSHSLGETEGFVDLLLLHLPLVRVDHNSTDEALELLEALPAEAVQARRAEIEAIGSKLATDAPWLAAHTIEILTRANCWAEARQVAQAGVDAGESTVRNQARRLYCQSMAISVRFEEAIGECRLTDLAQISKEWDDNVLERQEHDADVEKRNSRSSFPGSL